MLQSGQQIFRTLLVGQILYFITKQSIITSIFAILSLQNIDIQTDFFSILTLMSYIISTITMCLDDYLLQQKKQNISYMFLENLCLFGSFSLGTTIIIAHTFRKLSPYVIAISVGLGKLFYEINVKDMKMNSQDDIANDAFGKIGSEITHGKSWFEINQKRYGIIANILNIVLTLSLSLLTTYEGKLATNFLMYIIIAASDFGIMLAQIFVTKTILSDKKIKDIIQPQKNKEQPKQQTKDEQDEVTVKHQEQKQEQIQEQNFKGLLAQLRIVDKLNISYYIVCLIVSFSLNYIRQKTMFSSTIKIIYNTLGLILSSFFISKALIYQHTYLLMAIPSLIVICNYNLPLQQVIYTLLQIIIRNNEKLPKSQFILLFASGSLMSLQNQIEFGWSLNIVYALFTTIIQLPMLQKHQIGQRIQIALQYFLLDSFISLPRSPYSNTIVNCITILCCYNYKAYSQAIMGVVAAQVQFISIIIRCSISTVNMLTLGDDNTNTICQKIVLWNGIFSIVISAILQASTFTKAKETINKCQASLLVISWIIISSLAAILPINITPIVILLYITNYVNNLQITSQFSTLSILVYQALNQNNWQTFNSNDIFMILSRIYIGILIGSTILYLIERKNQQSKLVNFFLNQMAASFISLYLSIQSVISNYNDTEVVGWFSVVISVGIYLLISFCQMIKLNSSVAKSLIVTVYMIIVVYSLITEHYSEGTVLFLTLLLLAVSPQSAIISGIIVGYLMMIAIMTTKYSVIKMTHQSVFQTIVIISVMWLLRYSLVKQSCIRRLTKKAKIEMPDCRINNQAFEVNEQELDVFLQLQEQDETQNDNHNKFYNEDAATVIRQLGWQMKTFVFLTCIMLYNIGFLSNIALLLGIACLLIPIITYDSEKNKVLRIAGYYSQQGEYELNESDKQQLVENYASITYDLISVKIIFDIIGYVIYYNKEKADISFSTDVIIDLALLPLILLLSFLNFTLICQRPVGLYSFLVEQQVEKIKVAVCATCILLSLFTTNGSIKVLAAWTCIALLVKSRPVKKNEVIEFQAPIEVASQ